MTPIHLSLTDDPHKVIAKEGENFFYIEHRSSIVDQNTYDFVSIFCTAFKEIASQLMSIKDDRVPEVGCLQIRRIYYNDKSGGYWVIIDQLSEANASGFIKGALDRYFLKVLEHTEFHQMLETTVRFFHRNLSDDKFSPNHKEYYQNLGI